MNNTHRERWVIIEDYPNYSVSDMGRVRNNKTGRILRPATNTSGYLYVNLSNCGKSKTHYVHRLVLGAFNANPNPKLYTDTNHIDNNKANNAIDNLEWATHQQNMRYGSAPPHIRRIGEEVKKAVIEVLQKYLPEANPSTVAAKIKQTAQNSLMYQQRYLN